MSNKKRLADLENAAGGGGPGGPGDNVKVIVDWTPDEEIRGYYIVDGVKMSEIEFRRRWPDWKPGAVDVKVNWD